MKFVLLIIACALCLGCTDNTTEKIDAIKSFTASCSKPVAGTLVLGQNNSLTLVCPEFKPIEIKPK